MSILRAEGMPQPPTSGGGGFLNPELNQFASGMAGGPQGFMQGGFGVDPGGINELLRYWSEIYWTESFEEVESRRPQPEQGPPSLPGTEAPRQPRPGEPGYGVTAPAETPDTDGPSDMLSAYSQQLQEGPSDVLGGVRERSFDTGRENERGRLEGLARTVFETDDPTPEQLSELWGWGVAQMESAHNMGLEPMDPWHWLHQRAGTMEDEKEALTGEVERVQKTINLTDPQTAQALVKGMFRNVLDRDPSDDDIAQFVDALSGFERDNPQVTTTTQTTDEEGNVVESESMTEGGADPNAFGQNWIDEEFGAEIETERIGGEWFDAVISAIGSPA